MDNEILYREFWIRCTKDKLIDLSEDLVHDARVEDFDKIESDICKSDAERFVNFVDWVLPIIEPLFPVSDTVSLNRIRMMKVVRSRLARRLNKT
jgi:hypothetical protein